MATLVVAIIFSTLNFNSTSFHYLFGQAELPLSVLLVAAFIGGFIAGLLLDAWIMYRQKMRIRKLESQLAAYESELSNLRKLPLKDFV
ncbi:MAG TPA: LapA family protein [Gammaproteobacteria bacterium]